jgi:hypothetical protein
MLRLRNAASEAWKHAMSAPASQRCGALAQASVATEATLNYADNNRQSCNISDRLLNEVDGYHRQAVQARDNVCAFFAAQSSADCTTNMFGFDFRQAQLRYGSAFRADKVGSPACRGSKRPAPHQDVAEIERRLMGTSDFRAWPLRTFQTVSEFVCQ